MKKLRNVLFLFILGALFLSGCAVGLSGTSWPGIAVEDNTIYFANQSFVVAIDGTSGAQKWRFPEKGSKSMFYAMPDVLGDQLIVGDYKDTLYSLNKNTGAQNWTFQAKGQWVASSLILNDTIYAPNSDHFIYALDKSGNLLWKFEGQKSFWSQPVTDGTTLYVSGLDHFLYAIDPKTGTKVWAQDLGGAVVYAPSLSADNSTLYVTTLANEVLALNAKTGNITWRKPYETTLWSQPVPMGENLIFGDLSGNVYAIKAADNQNVWMTPFTDPVTGRPTVVGDVVYIPTENGKLVALDANGAVKWIKTFEGKLFNGPVEITDKLLVGVVGGKIPLYLITNQNSDVWQFTPAK